MREQGLEAASGLLGLDAAEVEALYAEGVTAGRPVMATPVVV